MASIVEYMVAECMLYVCKLAMNYVLSCCCCFTYKQWQYMILFCMYYYYMSSEYLCTIDICNKHIYIEGMHILNSLYMRNWKILFLIPSVDPTSCSIDLHRNSKINDNILFRFINLFCLKICISIIELSIIEPISISIM